MRLLFEVGVAFLSCFWLNAGTSASGVDRTATQILAEIDAIKPPRLDPKRRDDPSALKELRRQVEEFQKRRDDLIWEMYETRPDHERVPGLLQKRWMHRVIGPRADADKALDEIGRVLAENKGKALATDVGFLRAEAILRKNFAKGGDRSVTDTLAAMDDAIRPSPGDARGATLLFGLLTAGGRDLPEATRNGVEGRVVTEYPRSPAAAALKRAQTERNTVGKPFVLEFRDAITGKAVSTKALRGKVVVVEFWATWCGPCVRKVPELKELYAKYHAQGVEFLGVSCDHSEKEGGLDQLKAFVARNAIGWPQYYQGGAGEGTVSYERGVLTIPAAFVIDRDGNLASADAQGKLGELIPALLRQDTPRE